MNVKTKYGIGDTVWIYGVARDNNKATQGKIVHQFNIDYSNHSLEVNYYVIEIPTSIDNLLEIRTWEAISQDSHGPVGALRQGLASDDPDAIDKKLSQVGLSFDETPNIGTDHTNVVGLESKKKSKHRKYYSRKKNKH